MVRIRHAVASRKSRKRLFKRAKGFIGDRKNHVRLTNCAVMKALAFSTTHRKLKKRDFASLWATRVNVAARINGISYSRLMNGLKRAKCLLNRKMLAELAVRDPQGFAAVATMAKGALAA